MDLTAIAQGGSGGLAAFALYIVWTQMKIANSANTDLISVVKANAVTNEKVASAIELNTEAIKTLVNIIQNKL